MPRRAVVMIATLALLLTGCSSSAKLDLLRADPMARASPEALVSQTLAEQAGGMTLGKDEPAHLIRRLVVDGQAPAALAELDEVATAAGWVARVPLTTGTVPVAAVYDKTTGSAALDLSLSWDGGDTVILALSTR